MPNTKLVPDTCQFSCINLQELSERGLRGSRIENYFRCFLFVFTRFDGLSSLPGAPIISLEHRVERLVLDRENSDGYLLEECRELSRLS